MLQGVGFFVELSHGDRSCGTLADARRDTPHALEEEIVAYLRAGTMLVGSPGVVFDVLSGAPVPIDTPAVLTDGQWMWPDDLAHYVETYHVCMPEAFVRHAEESGWTIPQDLDVECLGRELKAAS